MCVAEDQSHTHPSKSRRFHKLLYYRQLCSCCIDDKKCRYLTIYGSHTCQMTSHRHVFFINQVLNTLNEDTPHMSVMEKANQISDLSHLLNVIHYIIMEKSGAMTELYVFSKM